MLQSGVGTGPQCRRRGVSKAALDDDGGGVGDGAAVAVPERALAEVAAAGVAGDFERCEAVGVEADGAVEAFEFAVDDDGGGFQRGAAVALPTG